MKRVYAFLSLTRPLNALTGMAAFGIGMGVADVTLPPTQIILALVVIALSYAFANVDNDLVDREVDRWAHPHRPLVRGDLSPRAARWFAWGLAGGGISGGLAIGCEAAGFVAGMLGLTWVYNRWGKRWPFLGNLMVAGIASGVFPFLMLLSRHSSPRLLAVWGMAVGFHLSREIVKDCADMAGDRRAGYRTLPLVWGARQALGVALGVHGLLVLGLVGVWKGGVFSSTAFLLATILGYGGGGLVFLLRAWRSPRYCAQAARALKALLVPAFIGLMG